jgi:hypothetical protein
MPRAKWLQMVDASKAEALAAVDHFNSTQARRNIEDFYVHMHLAWLYLLHAEFRRDGIDYHYRRPNGQFERIDGEPKTWDLRRCVNQRWTDGHPVRKNLELTILLRNKIEHRFQEAAALTTTGYAQALLLNYEAELTGAFGNGHSLASQLRFPVFIGTFTEEGVEQMRRAQARLPQTLRRFLADFHADLDPTIEQDQRFEFRVHLVPKVGPRSEADLALSFVREDELTAEEQDVLVNLGRTGRVIVRERVRPVANSDLFKPREATERIAAALPFEFNLYAHFVPAWKKLGVRPMERDEHPERTKEEYCVYDRAHRDYLYTEAFINKVVRAVDTAEKFEAFFGRPPVRKVTSIARDSA